MESVFRLVFTVPIPGSGLSRFGLVSLMDSCYLVLGWFPATDSKVNIGYFLRYTIVLCITFTPNVTNSYLCNTNIEYMPDILDIHGCSPHQQISLDQCYFLSFLFLKPCDSPGRDAPSAIVLCLGSSSHQDRFTLIHLYHMPNVLSLSYQAQVHRMAP